MKRNVNTYKTDDNFIILCLYVVFLLSWVAFTVVIARAALTPIIILGFLTIASLPALFFPILIPITVFMFSPLLGQTSNATIGSLNAMSILALWFLTLGGVIVFRNIKKVLKRKLIVVSLLLVMLTILSILPSNSRAATVEEILRLSSTMLMLPLAVILGRQQKNRKIMTGAVIVSGIIPLSFGLYQKISGNAILGGANLTRYEINTGLVRIYSTFYDAHPFAKYLLILLSILFVLIIGKLKPTKLVYFTLFSVAFFELIFTYTRGQLIGIMLTFSAILYASRKLKIRHIIPFLPVLIILFYNTGVFERFSDLAIPGVSSGTRWNSLTFRLNLWQKALPAAINKPILGHGANTFDSAFGIIAHNDYLSLFYELGIAGLLVYVLFLFYAAKTTFVCSRKPGIDRFDRNLALAGFGSTLAIALGSFAENFFSATIMWWFFLGILGCVLAANSPKEIPGQQLPGNLARNKEQEKAGFISL